MGDKIKKPEKIIAGCSECPRKEFMNECCDVQGYNSAIRKMNKWLKSLCENELSEDILWRDYFIDNHKGDEGILEFIAKHIKDVLKV